MKTEALKEVNKKLSNVYTGQKRNRGKKDKKEKKFSYASAVLKGAKFKKEKGAEQKILDMIIKSVPDTKNYAGIVEYMKTQNYKLDEKDAQFYSVLASNIYNNNKINLNDLINSSNFLCTISMNSGINYPYKMNVFSNDRLTWISIIYERCKAEFKDILPLLLLDDMEISIRTIVAELKENYRKGFYIDFSKDVSFIGCNILSEAEKTSIYSAGNGGDLFNAVKNNEVIIKLGIKETDCFVGTYKIFNVDYTYKYISNGICLSHKTETNPADIIKNVKFIEGKSEKDAGLKIHPTKDSYYYISQKIKLTEFSPSIIETSDPLDSTFSITAEIDLNLFEQKSYDKFKASTNFTLGDLIPFNNFVFLDNFEAFMQFLIIELTVRYRDNADLKSNEKFQAFVAKADAIIKYYIDNKVMFKVVKTVLGNLIRFYLRFYDSYTNKINIDVSKTLKTQAEKISIEYEELKKNQNAMDFIAWIIDNFSFPGYKGLINSLNTKLHDTIINSIRTVLQDIMSATFDSLITNLYKAGQNCFLITFGNDNFMTREMRSPVSFMGNLQGEDLSKAKEEASKIAKSALKVKKSVEEEARFLLAIASDKNAFKKGVAILSTPKNIEENYDVKTKKFSDNFETFYTASSDEIESSYKDKEENIKLYGATCDLKETYSDPNAFELGEVNEELVKKFETFAKENTLKLELKKVKMKKKIDDMEAEMKDEGISKLKLSDFSSFGFNTELAKKYNKGLKSYEDHLVTKEKKMTKEEVKALKDSGLIPIYSSLGMTVDALADYIKAEEIDASDYVTALNSKKAAFGVAKYEKYAKSKSSKTTTTSEVKDEDIY